MAKNELKIDVDVRDKWLIKLSWIKLVIVKYWIVAGRNKTHTILGVQLFGLGLFYENRKRLKLLRGCKWR